MARSILPSFKRAVAVGTALALLGGPFNASMQALAQTAPPAPPSAAPPSAAPEATSPGGMLPAPPPTAPTINAPPPRASAVPAGPSSVSDLAEGLLDAVVNISTSQSVKDEGAGPQPQIQQGSPFEEFFDDFFDDKGGEGKNQKVSSLGSGFVSTRPAMWSPTTT